MTVGDLKKYKDNLYSALSRDLSDFEKNFLLIAAGVLTFSITFIKDIVTIKSALYLFCLFIGWFLFALAVGVMMFTFIKSAYASDEIWFEVDDFLLQREKFEDDDTLSDDEAKSIKTSTNQILIKRKKQLRRMRSFAIASFLTGLLFFGFFVAINLFSENHAPSTGRIDTLKIDRKTRNLNLNGMKIEVNDSLIQFKSNPDH